MDKKKGPSPLSIVWQWAKEEHKEFYAAIVLAVIGVAGTMTAYFGMAALIRLLLAGGGFSEGQAQRLSIARAILRKSPILLLDEATSALDVATERKLLKNLMKDEYPRTCLVTTHRPTVLEVCTRVYAIRDKHLDALTEEEINYFRL